MIFSVRSPEHDLHALLIFFVTVPSRLLTFADLLSYTLWYADSHSAISFCNLEPIFHHVFNCSYVVATHLNLVDNVRHAFDLAQRV